VDFKLGEVFRTQALKVRGLGLPPGSAWHGSALLSGWEESGSHRRKSRGVVAARSLALEPARSGPCCWGCRPRRIRWLGPVDCRRNVAGRSKASSNGAPWAWLAAEGRWPSLARWRGWEWSARWRRSALGRLKLQLLGRDGGRVARERFNAWSPAEGRRTSCGLSEMPRP
jgi:hypothetical protein